MATMQSDKSYFVNKKIKLLERQIRSKHLIGSIKIRTTGKVIELIWKRIGFLEFDKHFLSDTDLKSTKKKINLKFFSNPAVAKNRAIYPEKGGFLYCNYKCILVENQEKLILIEKYPILMASGRPRKKITKALNTLSKILACSTELKKISLLLNLYWQTHVKG